MPPSDTLTKSLFSALAIELASDVFPTPGGPTKHIIGLFEVFVFWFIINRLPYF